MCRARVYYIWIMFGKNSIYEFISWNIYIILSSLQCIITEKVKCETWPKLSIANTHEAKKNEKKKFNNDETCKNGMKKADKMRKKDNCE